MHRKKFVHTKLKCKGITIWIKSLRAELTFTLKSKHDICQNPKKEKKKKKKDNSLEFLLFVKKFKKKERKSFFHFFL